MLLQALRSDSEKYFACIMTDNESLFYEIHDAPIIFEHGGDEAISRVS
jgi:hypothetical protein